MPAHQKPCYQPVKNFTDWSVLGSFTNCNVIPLPHKSTYSEDVEKIYQLVPYGISDSMDALVQNGQYSTMNTTDTTTKGYYVIKTFHK